MISLSEIQQYDPGHLSDLADHYNKVADLRGNTMDSIRSSDSALAWTGLGRAGEQTAMEGHAATATGQAQVLRSTATLATDGYNELSGSRKLLLESVQTAQDGDFEVGDDFEATDRNELRAMYAPGIADGVTADLQTQAQAFDAQRDAVAAGITAGAAPLGSMQCWDNGSGKSFTCVELLPDRSTYTWSNAPGDLSGNWPDAAKAGEGHVSMMGGPDDGDIYPFDPNGVPRGPEPPSKGSIGIPVGPAGGQTPLETDLGGAPMPTDWPKQTQSPPSWWHGLRVYMHDDDPGSGQVHHEGFSPQQGHVALMDYKTSPGLPPPVPPGPAVNNGPLQTPWPPATGVPESVANPQAHVPVNVINTQPAPDPGKHDCGPMEMAKDDAEVGGGSTLIAGALLGSPATGMGAAGAVAGGIGLIDAGIQNIQNCNPPDYPGASIWERVVGGS